MNMRLLRFLPIVPLLLCLPEAAAVSFPGHPTFGLPVLRIAIPSPAFLIQTSPRKSPRKKVIPRKPTTKRPSAPATSATATQQSTSPNRGKKLLLTVSVESFADPGIAELRHVTRTVQTVRERLIDGGFSESSAVALGNRNASSQGMALKAPTRSAVMDSIQKMLAQAAPEDQVLIYLAGHGFGIPVQDEDQKFLSFFCLQDTPKTAFSDVAIANETSLSIDQLITRMRSCKASEKLLIVEACQDTPDSMPLQFETRLKNRGNVWVITSCSAGQKAQVRPLNQNSLPVPVFSGYFADALNRSVTHDDDGDGIISVREAFNYAHRQTVQNRDSVLQKSGYTLSAGENWTARQVPRIFVGRGLFSLVSIPTVVPPRGVVSTNEQQERRVIAEDKSRKAAILLNAAESLYSEQKLASKAAEEQNPQASDSGPQSGYRLLASYALNGYLRDAQIIYPDTREATLVLARYERSAGRYSQALAAFQAVGMPTMRVFASGSIPPASMFYGLTEDELKNAFQRQSINSRMSDEQIYQQFAPGVDLENVQELVSSIATYTQPSEDSLNAIRISASSAVEVSSTHTDADNQLWLQVSSVENLELPQGQPIWVKSTDVHWCREAAQMYVESGDFLTSLSSIIASQQRNAELATMEPKFTEEIAKLREAQRKMEIAARILGQIPWTRGVAGWIRYAKSWVAFAESLEHTKMQQTYRNYESTRMYQRSEHQSLIAEYLDFIQERENLEQETKENAGISGSRVRVSGSPWSE